MEFPAEVLKKVKLIELSTRKLVNNIFSGEYHTMFKGRGMMFADFREYVPGDDVRSISWPLTAKAGKPYVKEYEEEREMTLILAVDISGSADFGTGPYFKGEVMTYLAAVLAFSAVKNNDQVGLLLFSDQVEHFVPPKKGRGHVYRILRDLLYFKPHSTKTRMATALQYLDGILKKRAAIFLFSDFMDEGFDKPLRILGDRHDLVACVVQDAAEEQLPDWGMVDLQDPESGEIITVDTASKVFRDSYRVNHKKRKDIRDQMLRRAQVDRVDLTTQEDYFDPLIKYFRKKSRG